MTTPTPRVHLSEAEAAELRACRQPTLTAPGAPSVTPSRGGRLAYMRDMTTSCLRSCAGCSGFFAAHNSHSLDGAYFCDKCMPKMMPADFDPQPSDIVRFIDGPRGDWVVVGRDGDMVSIRRLGFPEAEPRPVSIHALYPRR